MTDPERLSHQDGDDFERALLRSARRDGPSPQGKKRTLLALGLGTALAGGASSTAVAAPSVAATVVKWMAVGALVGTGTLASVSVLTSSGPQAPPPVAPAARPSGGIGASRPRLPAVVPSPEPGPSAPGTSPEPPPVRAVLPPPAPRPTATEEAPPAVRVEPPAASVRQEPAVEAPPAATAVVEDPLVGELLALDGARAALGRGDLAGAQAALGRYGERYPRGKLSTEARILRIELLLRQGNREAAHQEASEFLRAHPQSPHAPRLRALLGISTP